MPPNGWLSLRGGAEILRFHLCLCRWLRLETIQPCGSVISRHCSDANVCSAVQYGNRMEALSMAIFRLQPTYARLLVFPKTNARGLVGFSATASRRVARHVTKRDANITSGEGMNFTWKSFDVVIKLFNFPEALVKLRLYSALICCILLCLVFLESLYISSWIKFGDTMIKI